MKERNPVVRSLTALNPSDVASIESVVFDLDDTLLDHGRLTLAAYEALHRLAHAGFRLVACTGRPSTWAELACRQWPIHAAIAENGAIAWVRRGGRVVLQDRLSPEERSGRRAVLCEHFDALRSAFPVLTLADDAGGRLTDIAVDVGEHAALEPSVVRAVRVAAHRRGLRTFQSSIHLHLTLESSDKASGYAYFFAERTAAELFSRSAYVGDSENDASAFGVFGVTLGVANVRRHLKKFTLPPRFCSSASMGEGFAEIAEHLIAAKVPPKG